MSLLFAGSVNTVANYKDKSGHGNDVFNITAVSDGSNLYVTP